MNFQPDRVERIEVKVGAAREVEKSKATLFWAYAMGFLAFIVAVGNFFEALPKVFLSEHQLWFTEFLPDLAVALVAVGLLPAVLGPARVDWRESLRKVASQRKLGVAGLCALALVAVILAAVLASPVGELYKVRHQRTFVDWHAVRALDLVRTKDFEGAKQQLQKATRKTNPEKLAMVENDIAGRLTDAQTYIKRFRDHKVQARSPTFDDVLLVGRAAQIAPQVADVKVAMSEARKIIEEAKNPYLRGIERIKQGNAAGAVDELRRSKTACQGLLHQDLLIRYARDPHSKSFTADERAMIDYYLKTPSETLRKNVLEYPPIRLFGVS